MASGMTGTPARRAKYAVPSASGSSSRSPRWILPSPAITITHPSSRIRVTRRVVSSMSVFAGRYGIPKPAHEMSRLRAPFVMSSSFGPNIAYFGAAGSAASRTRGSVQLRWLKQ